jgi:hypothetical protein
MTSGQITMASVDQAANNSPMPRIESNSLLRNPARLRLVAWIWIGNAVLIYLIDLLPQIRGGLSDGLGRPFGDDFINYWSAAFLALHGRAAEIYDFAAFHAFEQSVVAQGIKYYHYSYPPVLLLWTLPLALIPYAPALFIWLGATWYAFYRALRLTGYAGALLLSLATPALLVNAIGGQNGAITAALLGGGLMLVDRRPIVAGILLGMMVYKPHLALMLPFALFAGRRWLVAFVTGATAALLVMMSVAFYGADVWLQYQHNISVLRDVILEDGAGVSHRMVSVFVFARYLGADVAASYAWQAVAALLAVVFIARSWWRDEPAHIRNVLLLVGTSLATPYLQDYDLVFGAFVVAWLLVAERDSQISPQYIRGANGVILVLPLLNAPIAKSFGLPIGPLVFLPVFALLIRLGAEYSCKRAVR